MPLTWDDARTILQSRIADSSDDVAVDQALNLAQRKVAKARRWPELMKRAFFNTVAAYSTGTVATDGTTAVVLTGGTWPTAVATAPSKYRFALSLSDPWYEITTRTDANNIVLAAAYVDDDQTASSYITYKSHYSLAADVERVEEIWVHDAGRAVALVDAATDQTVTEFLHFPGGPGTPTHFYHLERDSAGGKQILLGPETPDDVYRVEYTYQKKVVDDTFQGNLDESRWPAILARASAILYEPEFYERHLTAMAEYRSLLKEEWSSEGDSTSQSLRVGQNRYNYPNAGNGYLDYLMGQGRVVDPT